MEVNKTLGAPNSTPFLIQSLTSNPVLSLPELVYTSHLDSDIFFASTDKIMD